MWFVRALYQSLKNCPNFKFIFDEKLLRRFNLFTSKKAATDEGCCLAESEVRNFLMSLNGKNFYCARERSILLLAAKNVVILFYGDGTRLFFELVRRRA